jgi:tRNA dimethylallyltransferase
MAPRTPLIVITGPTGSGKSAIALSLAEKYGGEIICADSRTVYKFMDIGTAKPSLDDQKRVKHWLLDVVNPDDKFSVSDFQELAQKAINNIRSRGKIPFLVGGTGLYIDAVVLDFSFAEKADLELRTELEMLTTEQLKELIKK